MKSMNKDLLNRLNRIVGQTNALKSSVEKNACLDVIYQVKAIDRALKKFALAYTKEHMQTCLDTNKSKKELEKQFSEILESAFTI